MELKEFVAETICQIAEGITDAQRKTNKTGALINPPLYISTEGVQINDGNKRNFIAQSIDFDISVTVENSNNTGGKAKISVAMLGLEGGKDSKQSSSSQSRITFSVPVSWPPAREPEKDTAASYEAALPRDDRWKGF